MFVGRRGGYGGEIGKQVRTVCVCVCVCGTNQESRLCCCR